MTDTISTIPPRPFLTRDLSFTAWVITTGKLKFIGSEPHPRRKNTYCFAFEDPHREAITLTREFISGSPMADVRKFLDARKMLLDLINGLGDDHEQLTR